MLILLVKWSQRFRTTGSAAAKPMGGWRPYEGEHHWLLTRVSEAPDLTLRALAAELAQRGITVSHYAVWHFLLREETPAYVDRGFVWQVEPTLSARGDHRRGARVALDGWLADLCSMTATLLPHCYFLLLGTEMAGAQRESITTCCAVTPSP